MTTFENHPDFTLFPFQSRSKMMALEATRSKQPSYFDPMTMDPSMFSFPMESIPQYGQTHDMVHASNSYYDTHSFESADPQKPTYFSTMPPTPPSLYASHSEEPYMPARSAASGPSIASASSSAMGSPYSGATHTFQDNWVNTNHGLGLPVAVVNDLFPQEYMGNPADLDMLYQEKFPDSFVGTFDPNCRGCRAY
jgi:hypothetical protein